jgi:membrane-bound lytic murein transglycosylase D
MISQKYGVRLKKLKKYNRLETEMIQAGTTLWLSSMKPKDAENQVIAGEVVEVDNEETFNWSATPDEEVVATVSQRTETIIVTTQPETQPGQTVPPVVEDSVKTLQLTQETQVSSDSTQLIVIPAINPDNSEHIVQPKETLYAIAKIYNVGVMDLVRWNNLDLQQGIKIGQVLRVKESELLAQSVQTPIEVFHEVMASDTLYSIARKYGVTIKDLMEWNEKKDFSVSVGEKLKVKQGQ